MSHGLRSTYVKGCRCEQCRRANTRYAKWRGLDGVVQLVDATVTRQHLDALRAAGLGRREIARRSGVALTVINRLIGIDSSRPARRVRPVTQARILAVTVDCRAGGSLVYATGTTRRLQALVALGWTQTELAARIGWTVQNLGPLVHGQRWLVAQSTASLVAALFGELSMIPGPSIRARLLAQRRGWAPPLAWEDIDDVAEHPSEIAVTA